MAKDKMERDRVVTRRYCVLSELNGQYVSLRWPESIRRKGNGATDAVDGTDEAVAKQDIVVAQTADGHEWNHGYLSINNAAQFARAVKANPKLLDTIIAQHAKAEQARIAMGANSASSGVATASAAEGLPG